MIHTVKGFSIVNETEVNIFLEFPCFFYDLAHVGNLISAFRIWKFSVHILLNPSLKDFEHNLASMWNVCNCMVIWTSLGIALLWNWNENWPSPVLWPLLSFPNLLAYWVQHFHSIIFQDLNNSSTGIPSPPLTLFIVVLSKAHLTSHSRMSG